MSERNKHLFQFQAFEIAKAARAETTWHGLRIAFWQAALEAATKRVEETAGVKVQRVAISGGWRPEVVVSYGDPAAYQRMQESASKIQQHRAAKERYESDATLYDTQGNRVYELDGEDVAHFRLNGKPREEES